MKIQVSLADPLFIVGAFWLGCVYNGWWVMLVPVVIASWFLNPRWSREAGWRIFHE